MTIKTTMVWSAGLLAALASVPGWAASLSYSGYSVTNQQNVVINDTALGIVNESGGSGQIILQTPSGPVDAWCVDIATFLQASGTYALGAPPPPAAPLLTLAQIAQIGGLIKYGDANVGTGYDYSSATQLAIWTIEYAGTGFSYVGGPSGLADALVTEAQDGTIPGDANWIALSSLDSQGVATDQGLGSGVPEPASWAMMLAGFGLAGATLRRRRGQVLLSA